MSKWKTPTSSAEEHELADFIELVSWRDGCMSAVELIQLLGRSDEPDYASDVPEDEPEYRSGVPEEDETDFRAQSAFAEVERRRNACAGAYPFALHNDGQSVRFDPKENDDRHAVYLFLLLATRLNMKENRQHGGLDGTRVFEEVGAQSARCYLGPRAESLVFGTGAGGQFASKVEDLCRRLGEGDGFVDRYGGGEKVKDDGLDIVAWTPFSDQQQSKVIIFGQCKTGTHFRDKLAELQPSTFWKSWWHSPPALAPTRTFFVAEALPRIGWGRIAAKAGLLFDRCRIVDFSEAISADVVEKVRTWTSKAAAAAGLPSL